MSARTAGVAAGPWLELPGGFPPDTLGFACRTVLALLLAYYVSFWIQLSSASTAGICVAIVAQPQLGGTLSKAAYRVIGTVIGGIAAVAATAAFPQDRTTLLLVFISWLAACSFAASLLKDFRAYGAALAGYTLAIVSVTDIDLPQDVFLTALDRVAAILVGVASVAAVNGVFGRADTWQSLAHQVQAKIGQTTEQAIRTLRADPAASSAAEDAQEVTDILALRTQATFVADERGGHNRAAGARSAIAALLEMMSASRAIAAGLAGTQPDPALQAAIDHTADALRGDDSQATEVAAPQSLPQALLFERLAELRTQHALALDGLDALATGRAPVRRVTLGSHHDPVGAGFNAARTAIVAALASVFCIYAGWSGATFLLVQISAVVALLGMQPRPTRAAIAFAGQVPVPIVAAGLVEFLLLPQAGAFVPFAIAVAPFAFAACVIARHPRLGSGAGTGMLIWYVLMLASTNPPSYDLTTFLNTAMELVGSVLTLIFGFAVVLPVSPGRRLFRVMEAAIRDVRQRRPGTPPGKRDDRLASGLVWIDRKSPTRLSLLARLRDLGDLAAALDRAQPALAEMLHDTPGHDTPPLAPGALQDAGAALLAAAGPDPAPRRAAAALCCEASILLMRQRRLLRRAGVPVGP